MSAIPVKHSPLTGPAESVEQKFNRLATSWRAETVHVSSTSELTAHPAFLQIVDMGPAVIPFLLRELEKGSGHWHRALRCIAGVDPVPLDDRGSIGKAAAAWVQWGREQGYQW